MALGRQAAVQEELLVGWHEVPSAHCMLPTGLIRSCGETSGPSSNVIAYLVHVAGCNLGLLMRALFGAGTPRAAEDVRSFWLAAGDCLLLVLLLCPNTSPAAIGSATRPAFALVTSTPGDGALSTGCLKILSVGSHGRVLCTASKLQMKPPPHQRCNLERKSAAKESGSANAGARNLA